MPRFVRRIQFLLMLTALAVAAVAQAGGGFIDHRDGTLTDPGHGLMWQKADDGVERSWQEAEAYCENLELAGHKDWMLPKADQLEMLIDTAYSPTIDPMFSVKPSYYWSATESADNPNSAKYVNFFYGDTYSYNKNNPYFVICVREEKRVAGKELAAVFTGEQVAEAPLTIRFTPTVTGGSEPYFYDWEFGDGNVSSRTAPIHEFSKAGKYEVLLTVSDNNGGIAVASQEITLPLAALPTGPAADEEEAATSAETPAETAPAQPAPAAVTEKGPKPEETREEKS